MSFTTEVKKEILSNEELSFCCRKALMLGILHGSSTINLTSKGPKLVVKSYILNAIKLVSNYIKTEYEISGDIIVKDEQINKVRRYYYFEIKEKVKEIVDDFQLPPFYELNYKHPFIKKECCQGSFIAGMFVSKGSISDPRKTAYHYEISCYDENIAKIIIDILAEFEITASIIERKNSFVVYVKRSEHISNCLALMKANSGVFYFEDSRIYRDYSNMANRISNCDVANERRCLESCFAQLEAIYYLRDKGYFKTMPVRLQSIARLREMYPDSSFEELATFSDNEFGKPMTKSGIAHCMKALMEFYQSKKLQEKNKKNSN